MYHANVVVHRVSMFFSVWHPVVVVWTIIVIAWCLGTTMLVVATVVVLLFLFLGDYIPKESEMSHEYPAYVEESILSQHA